METRVRSFTLFLGHKLILSGELEAVAEEAKVLLLAGETQRVAIFDDQSGRSVDVDYSGTLEEVVARIPGHPLLQTGLESEPEKRGGPGRPKIGVVSREVSLLPRHWDWLNDQPNGASGTLRVLVEEARKKNLGRDQARHLRDALHKFLWDITGDLPNFEEATRALFAKDFDKFRSMTSDWPKDVLTYIAPRVAELEGMRELL